MSVDILIAGAVAGIGWTCVVYGAAFKLGQRVGRADEANSRRADRHRYVPEQVAMPDPPAPVSARTFAMGMTLQERNAVKREAEVTHVDGLPKSYLIDFCACDTRADWTHAATAYSACNRWFQLHGLRDAKAWRADLDTAQRRRFALYRVVEAQTITRERLAT